MPQRRRVFHGDFRGRFDGHISHGICVCVQCGGILSMQYSMYQRVFDPERGLNQDSDCLNVDAFRSIMILDSSGGCSRGGVLEISFPTSLSPFLVNPTRNSLAGVAPFKIAFVLFRLICSRARIARSLTAYGCMRFTR